MTNGTPTPVNTWISSSGCAPAPTTLPPINFQMQLTLYYVAAQGQTNFPLSTPDHYGSTALVTPTANLAVSVGGNRLALDDGTKFGGFTVDSVNNAVNLVWPAGQGEVIIIDLYDAEPAP
jgi:hypothetical protein